MRASLGKDASIDSDDGGADTRLGQGPAELRRSTPGARGVLIVHRLSVASATATGATEVARPLRGGAAVCRPTG